MAALTALLGFFLTQRVWSVRDLPTDGKTEIVGVVCAVDDKDHVRLKEVIAGENPVPSRPVRVKLMEEEGLPRETVRVGQTVYGVGKLFAPQEERNPGGMDGRVRALSRGYELSGYILPGWQAEGEGTFSFPDALCQIRMKLSAHLERTFGEGAPLFQAVLLGEREKMEKDVVTAMRLTGTAHLLTISGLHLSLIAMALDGVLHHLPISRWTRFGLLGGILSLYTALTGGAAGTVRALIMSMMRALACCRGRQYDSLTALAAAALLMGLFNPIWVLDKSFQFSFFVVLGILLLSGRLSAFLERFAIFKRYPHFCGLFSVSLSAQTAAIPMELLLYGYLPVMALPMNLFTGILMPIIMLGGFFCAAVCAVLPAAGMLLGRLLTLCTALMEQANLSAAKVGVCRLPAPYGASLFFFALAMAFSSRKIRFGKLRNAALAAMAALVFLLYVPRFLTPPCYVQLDVGQGDGAVIRRGQNAVLVDVGSAKNYAVLRYLRHEGLNVEAVILSHLDEDHAGALGMLLRSEIPIKRIIMAEGAEDRKLSEAVAQALLSAEQMQIPIEHAEAGDWIETQTAAFQVLSPDETIQGKNERSLVLLTEFEGTCFLLTGDLPAKSEMEHAPDCDVLKVAHHGSKHSTSEQFIEDTTPEAALISVGANSYGHPGERVLEDLEEAGAAVYRTDQSGCITILPGGGGFRTETYLDGPS